MKEIYQLYIWNDIHNWWEPDVKFANAKLAMMQQQILEYKFGIPTRVSYAGSMLYANTLAKRYISIR